MPIIEGICEQCLVDGLSQQTLAIIVDIGMNNKDKLPESAQIVVAAATKKLQLGDVISS